LPNDAPGFAGGGFPRGLSWVGERGPELAEFPPGTRIHSVESSEGIMRDTMSGFGGAGRNQSFRQPLEVKVMLEKRVLAEEILEIIKYDSDVSAQILRNNKRGM
jgi:hypothetical protein